MKRIAAILLIFIVLMQCSMRLAIITYYQINKAYISSTLCVNKEKPKMGCNGKCYLAKKLKAQEEGEKKIPSFVKGMEEMVLFCSSYSIQITLPSYNLSTNMNGHYSPSFYKSPTLGIFQP